jgi:hypothetical protein
VQIMFCVPKWINDHYVIPMTQFLHVLQRAEAGGRLVGPSRTTSDCCCLLL